MTYDAERESIAELHRKQSEIQEERKYRCFPVINRGQLWYDKLTIDELETVKVWYQQWLDAPNTLVIPETPSFIFEK